MQVMRKTAETTLADKLFPPEEQYADSILSIPPEQRRLHTETYDFSIATIHQYLSARNMFIPEFQRRYVWSKIQASRLIESLIIQCPIPVIYLSQERDERLSVIDGNQRLQSIRKFLNNEFELQGLTAYPELDGMRFDELDPRFQRHINNRTLRCIVIMKDTHPQVKFDVFERLNTGAVELSAQELRHGLFHGQLIEWVGQRSKDKVWRDLVRAGNNKRMKAEEFLIRFLALHYGLESYEKPLAIFLNQFAADHRDPDDATISQYSNLFDWTIKGVENIFGDLAFAIFDIKSKYKIISSFNAALFDAEMIAVSRSNKIPKTVTKEQREAILNHVGMLFFDDNFQKAITRATSDSAQLHLRIQKMADLLESSF